MSHSAQDSYTLGADTAVQLSTLSSREGLAIPLRVFRPRGSSVKQRQQQLGESAHPREHLPAVAIHSFFDHSGWAAAFAPALTSAGIAVYCFDRRGSGLSQEQRGECSSYEDILNDLTTVIQHALTQEQCPAIHLLGTGFGALPALIFAIEHPTLVASLTLRSPALFSDLYEIGATASLLRLRRPLSKRFHAEMLTDNQQFQEIMRRDILALQSLHRSVCREAKRMQRVIQRTIGDFRVPLCAMLAGDDVYSNEEEHREFFGLMDSPFTSILYYPEARHCIEYSPERSQHFADIQTWVLEVERSFFGSRAFAFHGKAKF